MANNKDQIMSAGVSTELGDSLNGLTAKTSAGRKTYTPQEQFELREQLSTTGRKGVKALRVNFVLTPTHDDYVHIMAKSQGLTISQFLHGVIEKDLMEHEQEFKDLQARRNRYWSRNSEN